MAKQYKVKDINNNGKIDGWEQGKYDAINKSATKMGYSMKMGSKENYSPTNFKTKDAMLMAQSPMMMDDPKKKKNNSTTFSVDPDKGAKLETKVTTTNKPIQSSQSVQKKSTSNLANYQKGLKNLGPDFKPTKAQTAAANKKVAELKKKDSDAAAYNASIKKSTPKSTSTTKIDKKVNPTTVKQINKESKQKVSKAIGEENFRRYNVEMQAKKDSTATAQRYIGSKMKFLGRNSELDKKIYRTAGEMGSGSANATRKKGFVKQVKRKNNQRYTYTRKGGYLIK